MKKKLRSSGEVFQVGGGNLFKFSEEYTPLIFTCQNSQLSTCHIFLLVKVEAFLMYFESESRTKLDFLLV